MNETISLFDKYDSKLYEGDKNLKINDSQFDKIAEILKSVLIEFKVEKNDIL